MITNLRKKAKLNPVLAKVIIISLLIHVVLGVVASFVSIAHHVIKDRAAFEEPPLSVDEKPPAEVKVMLDVSKPSIPQLQNLSLRPVSNIAVADIDISMPSMSDNFTVSAGIGRGVGGKLLSGTRGSIGIGVSEINVFGLKTRAERILFVIDANRRMLTDAKGGLNSYRVIKDEVADMVGNLSPGSLFNVLLYDHRRIVRFKANLVPAGKESHSALVAWIGKINSDSDQPGLHAEQGAEWPDLTAFDEHEMQKIIEWSHGYNDTAFITQVAIEQNADAIFMITGYHRGFVTLAAPPSAKRLQEWNNYKASEQYLARVALYNQEVPKMVKRIDNKLAEINSERSQKGLPARVLKNPRSDVRGNANELALSWANPHPPGGPGHEDIDRRKGIQYFKELLQHRFTDQNLNPPTLNIILFLAGDEEFKPEWQESLKEYARFFEGKSRILRGANEIKSARAAAQTKN